MNKQPAKTDYSPVIDLLNQVLTLEYSIIIHFPRISGVFKDRDIRDKALYLSSASVKHAGVVSEAIESLGGKAEWNFEPFPDDGNLVRMFEEQVDKEKLAHRLHMECVKLLPEGLKPKFRQIAAEEEWHEKIASEVLQYLRARSETISG
ncbi:bacterioferritin [Dehalogenimonas formicexedens]|uniref:Bacterioferritin n=2 Tax=Dehalogenimonas TaxID=670486 RepID=A0A1P8F5Y9_9CHLR|nr:MULTISPECIES: ferritin-like domain-containing protein [Dehalogenimonas]APV43850.1 bacterioferritin [Dehalogenimonas formicexedens]KTB49319.1 hypothetical protein DEALK_02320 [Dehalogenimonas alkenigignens]